MFKILSAPSAKVADAQFVKILSPYGFEVSSVLKESDELNPLFLADYLPIYLRQRGKAIIDGHEIKFFHLVANSTPVSIPAKKATIAQYPAAASPTGYMAEGEIRKALPNIIFQTVIDNVRGWALIRPLNNPFNRYDRPQSKIENNEWQGVGEIFSNTPTLAPVLSNRKLIELMRANDNICLSCKDGLFSVIYGGRPKDPEVEMILATVKSLV